jgi:hypothetical protein
MVASMIESKVDRTAGCWVATTAEKMPVPRAVRTVALKAGLSAGLTVELWVVRMAA